MGAALQLSVTLTSIDCGKCGGTYAINERYRAQQHEKGGTWHCPYCQCGWGYVKSEADKLREQIAERDRQLERSRAETERQRSARTMADNTARVLRGHVTRHKKRAAAGVCPCCKRTFGDMARHMKTKHPDYASEASDHAKARPR